MTLKQESNKHKIVQIFYKIAKVFLQMLGFDVQFVSPEDGAWGNDVGNNSYNGMVGMVQRYEDKRIQINSKL